MSWDNEEACPTLKEEGVNRNQSAYSPRGNGCPLPLAKRNDIKKLCLKCRLKVCVYENN